MGLEAVRNFGESLADGLIVGGGFVLFLALIGVMLVVTLFVERLYCLSVLVEEKFAKGVKR